MLKEIQRICKGGGEALPTSVLEVAILSREVVDSKRNNAKLMDRKISLVMELDKCRALHCFACDSVQNVEARVKAMERHVESMKSKSFKTVEDAAQTKKNSLCLSRR